ncbi:hypothetical protein GUJ93_ZPchr0012g18873 [Zizania palustris]|uniref:ARID domain-containing protein n=1 Tax=Zizania palustris TaxID=103762 RepID=A0A8J5WNC0_ZIZPA|nr:hypothetical protein GUJ93_ZPchr0012g18873 [Zizania palustris]
MGASPSLPPLSCKTTAPVPNSNRAPDQCAPTLTAAAWPPPPSFVSGASKAVIVVLSVSTTLRGQGYLAGQQIPSITLPEEHAPAVFESLLASFLAQTHGLPTPPARPVPPLLGDGSAVGLLPLYLTVQERGGFDAVVSWAAIAEEVGLEPAMDAPIKLVYYKYLCPLEQIIRRGGMRGEVVGGSGGARQLRPDGKFLPPAVDTRSAELLPLKRKREKLVGMLNWVRLVARGLDQRCSVRKTPGSHFSRVLMFRRQMFEDDGFSDKPLSGVTADDAEYNGWDDQLSAGWSSDHISRVNVCSLGLADIPEWTGKPSSPYEDQDMLRFHGEPVLIPKYNEDFHAATIGKGRPDKCNCSLRGSISCIRLHVAEKKTELKRELGLSYYAMGFDQCGEDAAVTWTKDEEKFETIIQQNQPSSKYQFFDKLIAAFPSKSKRDLVSYYYNVFEPRRRALQNRVLQDVCDVDNDDD